jgi:hypothetical protein
MPTTYEYEVEDMGEFARAEFGATVTFTVIYHAKGRDFAQVEHVEFYEWVAIPTVGTDGVIRIRDTKERREAPSWFAALVERKYQADMLAVYNRACDEARYSSSRADDHRDELISRELRGAK